MEHFKVNGKFCGVGNVDQEVSHLISEVLNSYQPIMPTVCQYSGEAINIASIALIDANPQNILFSNILVIDSSKQEEMLKHPKLEYNVHIGSVEFKLYFWNNMDYMESMLVKLEKVCSDLMNPALQPTPDKIFAKAMEMGVKGLISVTTPIFTSDKNTMTFHYTDLLSLIPANATSQLTLSL